MNVELLKEAYFWLERNAAPGVDGLTWKAYEQDMEANVSGFACPRTPGRVPSITIEAAVHRES